MNKLQYFFIAATTTFDAIEKIKLEKKLNDKVSSSNILSLSVVADNAVNGASDAIKTAAITQLKDTANFWYANCDTETAKSILANLKKLVASDFIKVQTDKTYANESTYSIGVGKIEFHINWRIVGLSDATMSTQTPITVNPAPEEPTTGDTTGDETTGS